MKKIDFIRKIVEKYNNTFEDGISQAKAKAFLEVMNDVVIENIFDKDGVPILDSLKLTTITKGARTARNPKTGESISVPEKRVPKAKFGKAFKEAVL